MLDAEKHVIVAFRPFIYDFGSRLVEVNAGVSKVVVFQSNWIQDGLVKTRVDVSLAE